VSLHPIDSFDNTSGGNLLKEMYAKDGTHLDDEFLVLASNSVPLSFYITRKGKFSFE